MGSRNVICGERERERERELNLYSTFVHGWFIQFVAISEECHHNPLNLPLPTLFWQTAAPNLFDQAMHRHAISHF